MTLAGAMAVLTTTRWRQVSDSQKSFARIMVLGSSAGGGNGERPLATSTAP